MTIGQRPTHRVPFPSNVVSHYSLSCHCFQLNLLLTLPDIIHTLLITRKSWNSPQARSSPSLSQKEKKRRLTQSISPAPLLISRRRRKSRRHPSKFGVAVAQKQQEIPWQIRPTCRPYSVLFLLSKEAFLGFFSRSWCLKCCDLLRCQRYLL